MMAHMRRPKHEGKEERSMPSSNPPPWPAAALKAYEPIRPLGKGGFGSVYLAKRKRGVTEGEPETSVDTTVALKLVGRGASASRTRSEAGYARREVQILSELKHSHIIRLVDVFYDDETKNGGDSSDPVPRCIALSLARGPTLELMLKKGGALGLPMAREITIQLVDTVAFLHSRAVIHRDIKPDNIIISGAKPTSDECYSDGLDGEQAVKEKRYNITLIDFGFARALKPSEISTDPGLYNVVQNVAPDLPLENESGNNKPLNPAVLALLEAPIDDGSQHGKKTKRGRKPVLDRSTSRQIVRDLSALGQRSYAAPEITRGVRKFTNNLSSSIHGSINRGRNSGRQSSRREADSDRPLAECVSDYGMVADAFSLGATCRYMLTGVPPHIAVDEFISLQKTPIAKMSKLVSKALKELTGKKTGREKRYRSVEELPPEAGQLIHSLTHWDPAKRTTVRGAKLFPWLRSRDGNEDDLSNKPVHFLKCALPEEIEEPE